MSFGEADSAGRQSLRLHALTGSQAREDSAVGELVLAGRTGEPAAADGIRIWAGRIVDSFYVDLSLLAIVNGAVAKGIAPDLSAWRPQDAENSFAGTTVESVVLEVSHRHPRLRPGARTGVWCATKLATDAGGWRQVNRAGHPMMWPIFWPGDTDFSNPANTRPVEALGGPAGQCGGPVHPGIEGGRPDRVVAERAEPLTQPRAQRVRLDRQAADRLVRGLHRRLAGAGPAHPVNVRRAAHHDQFGVGDNLRPGVGHRDDADIVGGLEPGPDGVGNQMRVAVHGLIDDHSAHDPHS